MSPKHSHKGPQKKPSRMQRSHDGHPAASGVAAAEERAADAPALDASAADSSSSALAAGGVAADGNGNSGLEGAEGNANRGEQGLQLIGQELVPVGESRRSEETVEGVQKEETPEDQFSSPSIQKPLGNSPEQLQIENIPFAKTNEQASQKGSADEGSMAVVPKGVWP